MPREIAKRDQVIFGNADRPDFCKQRTEPLEVMCLGLCRTGTTSMLEAMSILGYGTMYNSREMLRRHQEGFAAQALWDRLEPGKGVKFGLEQFESLFGEYRAISGDFVYCFPAELIELYPDAKVILTVRDDDEGKWLRSLEQTMWYGSQHWLGRILRHVDGLHARLFNYTEPYWRYMFLDDVPNHGIRVYREHNALVKRLAEGRLLVFNTKEGWEPLCKFLGKPVPGTPFPHVNKTDEYRLLFGTARKEAAIGVLRKVLLRGVLPSVVAVAVIWKRARIGTLLKGWRR